MPSSFKFKSYWKPTSAVSNKNEQVNDKYDATKSYLTTHWIQMRVTLECRPSKWTKYNQRQSLACVILSLKQYAVIVKYWERKCMGSFTCQDLDIGSKMRNVSHRSYIYYDPFIFSQLKLARKNRQPRSSSEFPNSNWTDLFSVFNCNE